VEGGDILLRRAASILTALAVALTGCSTDDTATTDAPTVTTVAQSDETAPEATTTTTVDVNPWADIVPGKRAMLRQLIVKMNERLDAGEYADIEFDLGPILTWIGRGDGGSVSYWNTVWLDLCATLEVTGTDDLGLAAYMAAPLTQVSGEYAPASYEQATWIGEATTASYCPQHLPAELQQLNPDDLREVAGLEG